MTKEDLIKMGFNSSNYNLFILRFLPPYKFGVTDLIGELGENGNFHLYNDNILYERKEDLLNVLKIVGSEIDKT